MKPVLGLIRTVVPVVYCGGLVYYFIDHAGSVEDAQEIGLGPTLLGLSIIGVVFCIPLILKIVAVIAALAGGAPRGGDDNFDAGAVVARHLERRPAETAVPPPAAGRDASRPSFGRKNR